MKVEDMAPHGRCVVCARQHPGGENVPGWHYLANSIPLGAMVCGQKCLAVAIDRFQRTGRVDTGIVRN